MIKAIKKKWNYFLNDTGAGNGCINLQAHYTILIQFPVSK
jgi:hypothetical protein